MTDRRPWRRCVAGAAFCASVRPAFMNTDAESPQTKTAASAPQKGSPSEIEPSPSAPPKSAPSCARPLRRRPPRASSTSEPLITPLGKEAPKSASCVTSPP